MIFTTDESEYKRLLQDNRLLLKAIYANDAFVDAWFCERDELEKTVMIGSVNLKITSNGLFGSINIPLASPDESILSATREAYLQIFEALKTFPEMTPIRYWNYVPAITKILQDGQTIYQLFNAGRYEAFQSFYGETLEDMPVPAASAVGANDHILKIELLAVPVPIAMIENKNQVPSYRYSKTYGRIAPFFSRGAIYDNNGQRLLLSSGTASVVGENSMYANDIYEQLSETIHNLRILGSQFNLKKSNIHYGFALEDIVLLRVHYKYEKDRSFLERFVPKFLAPTCKIAFLQADICREELLIELEAVFVKKGETEQGIQPKYLLGKDQRIRTESFEIHVAEHCNLKCRDCCNLSPFNPKKFMTLEEVKETCDFVKLHFKPDVFKIAGGEPTLHPQLDELLQIVRKSGVCSVIRVISNGLLLHKMSDSFWNNIDQLTISNYNSAPVRQKIVDEIKEKAKRHEVVLNIKYVEEFNEIFVDDAIEDKDRVQHIYDDCWMRHRCLIIRNGRFHKCTRSSYMDSFLKLKGKNSSVGNSTYSIEDGIALDDPAFKEKALSYLNSSKPLHSCEYCLGVSGNLRPNIQLKTLFKNV